MWIRRPTTWVTISLFVAAAGCFMIWWRFAFADAWMPNVATTALGLAGTITIVEWIIRREARERQRPRTERVLYWIGLDVRLFTTSLTLDYTGAHRSSYRPIPATLPEMIEQWQIDHDKEDVDRKHYTQGSRQGPLIVHAALDLADRLTYFRDRDVDVLEADFVREIDDFQWAAVQALQDVEIGAELGRTPEEQGVVDRIGADLIVRHFKRLTDAFFRYGDPGWNEIMDITREASAEIHARTPSSR